MIASAHLHVLGAILLASTVTFGDDSRPAPSADFVQKTWVPRFEEQASVIDSLASEIADVQGLQTVPAEELIPLAEKLRHTAKNLATLIGEFRADSTRRGFLIELGAIEECQAKTDACATQLLLVSGVPIPKLRDSVAGQMDRKPYGIFKNKLVDMVVSEAVDSWLETEGIGEILTADSFDQAKQLAIREAKEQSLLALQEKTIGWTDRPIYDLPSARAAIRFKVRTNVARVIRQYTARITGNELVLAFADRIILRWVEAELWPKLREALRPKGNIPERLKLSVATLEQSHVELNNLGGEQPEKQDLGQVLRAIERANGRLAATYFLKRDIIRAKDENAAIELAASMESLQRTIKLTQARFLLNNIEQMKAAEAAQVYFEEVAVQIAALKVLIKENSDSFIVFNSHLPADHNLTESDTFPSRAARVPMMVELYRPRDMSSARSRLLTPLDDKRVVPVRMDYLINAEFESQEVYAYFNATSDGAYEWIGDAPLRGLESGTHPITVTIVTEDHRTMQFVVPIEVELSRTSDETRVMQKQQLKQWTAKMQRIQGSGRPATRGEKVDAELTLLLVADVLTNETAAPSAEILNLLKGARTIHEKMTTRPDRRGGGAKSFDAGNSKPAQASNDAKLDFRFYLRLIRACRQMGTKDAFEVGRELLPKCEEIAKQNPDFEHELGAAYRDLASLAITSGGKIQPAAEYLTKEIDLDKRLNRFSDAVIETRRKDLPQDFTDSRETD
ncbi:MAG: hypothetical protein RIC12_01800 [Pirellulales bacterium]